MDILLHVCTVMHVMNKLLSKKLPQSGMEQIKIGTLELSYF